MSSSTATMGQATTGRQAVTLPLLVEPVDSFFCRNGRPMGQAMVGQGGLPQPQVLAGAMRTWFLHQANAPMLRGGGDGHAAAMERWKKDLGENAWILSIKFRGPWLCCVSAPRGGTAAAAEVFVPVPGDLVKPKAAAKEAEIIRLRPPRNVPPGWASPENLLPLLARSDEPLTAAGGFVGREGLQRYLDGEAPSETISERALFDYEQRTGIQIDPERLATEEGMIYSQRMVRLRSGVAFYAEMDLSAGGEAARDLLPAAGSTIRLGGEGRLARVRVAEAWAWPKAAKAGDGVNVVLTAPAAFGAPYWRPDFGSRLVAAAVPGHTAISGWDLAARRPKPMRNFVLAGSTYLLKDTTAYGKPLVAPADVEAGYGTYIEGVWTYG